MHPFFTSELTGGVGASPSRHISRQSSAELQHQQLSKTPSKFPTSPTRGISSGSPGPTTQTTAIGQRHPVGIHQRIPSTDGNRHLVRVKRQFYIYNKMIKIKFTAATGKGNRRKSTGSDSKTNATFDTGKAGAIAICDPNKTR